MELRNLVNLSKVEGLLPQMLPNSKKFRFQIPDSRFQISDLKLLFYEQRTTINHQPSTINYSSEQRTNIIQSTIKLQTFRLINTVFFVQTV